MKRLIIKGKDRIWPTVIWQGTQLVVYYIGEKDNEVEVRETRGIDFEEFFLHLDRGGSVFVTMKPDPSDRSHRRDGVVQSCLGHFTNVFCKDCRSEMEIDERTF
jgi:hypothetical protein